MRMRNFRKVLITAPFSFNSLVDLHESNCLIACHGLELYRYHLCRLLKYTIAIMRLVIYKSAHSKCSFPTQRSTIANQEHILLLTLTIMEMVGGCTESMSNTIYF